jgi:hypothetical protein
MGWGGVNDNGGREFDGFVTCIVALVRQIYNLGYVANHQIRTLTNEDNRIMEINCFKL